MKRREPLLHGSLITELERAIINTLRTDITKREIILDVLQLPYDEELKAAIAKRQKEEEKNMTLSEKRAKRKEIREFDYKRYRAYRAAGYKSVGAEIGKGAIRPHIQLITDNTAEGDIVCLTENKL